MPAEAIIENENSTTVPPANLVQMWDSLSHLRKLKFAQLRVVKTPAELEAVRVLRVRRLKPEYPKMSFDHDPLDYQSLILFSLDEFNKPFSTARLVVGGRHPMPQDKFIQPLQQRGWTFCEWSRFAIDDGDLQLLKSYYRAMYTLTKHMGFDAIVMSMKPRNIRMHERLVNATVVERDMGLNYGGEHDLACVVWRLSDTDHRFFKWAGEV